MSTDWVLMKPWTLVECWLRTSLHFFLVYRSELSAYLKTSQNTVTTKKFIQQNSFISIIEALFQRYQEAHKTAAEKGEQDRVHLNPHNQNVGGSKVNLILLICWLWHSPPSTALRRSGAHRRMQSRRTSVE